MNTKNLILAACAALALGAMTAEDAAAQPCRYDGGRYGYDVGYRGYGNSYGVGGTRNRPYNWRYDASPGYGGYSRNRPLSPFGPGDNSRYRNTRYNAGYGNTRSRYGTGFFGNSRQQPVAFRHGNHVDVEDGNRRFHVIGSGY